MARQIQDAYIVAATRTPVGKAPRGMLKNVRPDDMLAYVLKAALAKCPSLDPTAVEDRAIRTGDHCFGCTAGAGSSCGGALV